MTQYIYAFFSLYLKSGAPNAWTKTGDATEDNMSAVIAEEDEAANTVNSCVHSVERKLIEVASYMKDGTIDLTDTGINAAKSGTAATVFDHANDITDQGFVAEGETTDKMSSSEAGRKIKDATVSVKNATAALSRKSVDHTKDVADKGIDATKSGTATVWDHTKDMAENVTHSVYNTGSDICHAVKHGAEAGWQKVVGHE